MSFNRTHLNEIDSIVARLKELDDQSRVLNLRLSELLSENSDFIRANGSLVNMVISTLEGVGRPLTIREIHSLCGANYSALVSSMSRFYRNGHLTREKIDGKTYKYGLPTWETTSSKSMETKQINGD